MSKSVNKVILVGNVGKDPEIKYVPSGAPVAKLSFATNERFKDKAGEWQERTEWHTIIAWNRLAEIIGEYVQKGSKLYIEGRLHTSSWESAGQKQYRTEIVAHDIVLLGRNGVENTNDRSADSSTRKAIDHHSRETEITDEDVPF